MIDLADRHYVDFLWLQGKAALVGCALVSLLAERLAFHGRVAHHIDHQPEPDYRTEVAQKRSSLQPTSDPVGLVHRMMVAVQMDDHIHEMVVHSYVDLQAVPDLREVDRSAHNQRHEALLNPVGHGRRAFQSFFGRHFWKAWVEFLAGWAENEEGDHCLTNLEDLFFLAAQDVEVWMFDCQ